MNTLYGFVFGVYPYICLTVFLLGSLIRFDRDQYTWKSDSSQLLRSGMLRWGSNLFHIGILFLFFGHMVGLFTPHAVYGVFMFFTAGVFARMMFKRNAVPDPISAASKEPA